MKRYTQKDLGVLLQSFNSEVRLSELAQRLGRTTYAIALKLNGLSNENPQSFNPAQVRNYTRAELRKHRGNVKEQKRRWKKRRRGIAIPAYYPVLAYSELKSSIKWEIFSDYLSLYLESYNGRKQDFADKMQINPSQLSRYITGKTTPSRKFFQNFAKELELHPEVLRQIFSFC